MRFKSLRLLQMGLLISAVAMIVSCGPNGGSSSNPFSPPASGSVMAFGTDAPICDVESFTATITSAALIPQGGGTQVTLISSADPATVDFARLEGFTNILSAASAAPGTYNQLQLTLATPQMTAIDTTTSPPTAINIPTTLTTPTFTVSINPPLVVTSSATSGLMVDFNLRKYLQVDGTGQVTGTVDPQFTIGATTPSGGIVGEADSLYGLVQSTSTSGLPSGFTGSFTLTVADGVGQTYTVLINSDTTIEGDGAMTLGDLQANDFVEVDAVINTSGQIIAQTVDLEEQTSVSNKWSAFLGKIIGVTRDGSGNATSFTLLVDDELPRMNQTIPLHSGLTVSVSGTTHYITNWRQWNQQSFTFSPQTLGVAEKVAVFGVLGAGSPPTMAAGHVFLRPRNILGNFSTLQAAGSDNITGAFTMIPCGALFQENPVTVLTFPNTYFSGFSGLTGLTPAPTINVRGLLFYEQTSGTTRNGGSWIAPAWVMQARGVQQLPN